LKLVYRRYLFYWILLSYLPSSRSWLTTISKIVSDSWFLIGLEKVAVADDIIFSLSRLNTIARRDSFIIFRECTFNLQCMNHNANVRLVRCRTERKWWDWMRVTVWRGGTSRRNNLGLGDISGGCDGDKKRAWVSVAHSGFVLAGMMFTRFNVRFRT